MKKTIRLYITCFYEQIQMSVYQDKESLLGHSDLISRVAIKISSMRDDKCHTNMKALSINIIQVKYCAAESIKKVYGLLKTLGFEIIFHSNQLCKEFDDLEEYKNWILKFVSIDFNDLLSEEVEMLK